MNVKELNFFTQDRVQAIKSVDIALALQSVGYIAFSGGKDSVVLSHLFDKALPKNRIPRVFINTGIEYKAVVEFVKKCAELDDRIIILSSGVDVKEMLEKEGYPFKSKEHSAKLALLKAGSKAESVRKYFFDDSEENRRIRCPKILKYQREEDLGFNVSDKCCRILKKDVSHKWERENKKLIRILGLRKAEGGQRRFMNNCISYRDGKPSSYSPLIPMSNDFIEFYIKHNKLELCKLYNEPFNFDRTGCKGCPFNVHLGKELMRMKNQLPNEYKQCRKIWGKVYEEYERIGYRLKSENS